MRSTKKIVFNRIALAPSVSRSSSLFPPAFGSQCFLLLVDLKFLLAGSREQKKVKWCLEASRSVRGEKTERSGEGRSFFFLSSDDIDISQS